MHDIFWLYTKANIGLPIRVLFLDKAA